MTDNSADVTKEAERLYKAAEGTIPGTWAFDASQAIRALLAKLAGRELKLRAAESARDAALAEVLRLRADVDRLSTRVFTMRDNL